MKSKKEILESGILEEYVLGILSDTENSEVRSYLNSYPELKDHVSELEDSLLKLAQENAIAAPPVVKKQIMSEVNRQYGDLPKPTIRNSNSFSWVAFAASFLLLGLVTSGYLYSNKANELDELMSQYTTLQKSCDEQNLVVNRQAEIITFIQDDNTNALLLGGRLNGATTAAVVYWNNINQKALLDYKELPQCPLGMDYQMWADIDGVMINMGVLPRQSEGFIEIPYMKDAESLNITLEKEGGAQHPTVSRLVMNGQV